MKNKGSAVAVIGIGAVCIYLGYTGYLSAVWEAIKTGKGPSSTVTLSNTVDNPGPPANDGNESVAGEAMGRGYGYGGAASPGYVTSGQYYISPTGALMVSDAGTY